MQLPARPGRNAGNIFEAHNFWSEFDTLTHLALAVYDQDAVVISVYNAGASWHVAI